MKRSILMGTGVLVAAGLLLVTIAQAEKGHRGMRGGGPPPCADPIPTEIQTRLLEEFSAKGIDADGDGTLTCDEVKAFFDANPDLRPHPPCGPPPCTDPIPKEIQTRLLEKFSAKGIDADGDGTLTCDEVKAFFDANPDLRPHPPCGPPPCADPMPTEIQTRLLEEFSAKGIDADGDGSLTCNEVKAFFDANPDLRPHPPCGPPPCSDPMPTEIQTRLLEEFSAKRIDADGDGSLTCNEVKAFFDANPDLRPHRPCGPPPCADPMPTEIQTRLLEEFSAKGIDADGDGTLTCEEVKAFFDANPDLRPHRGGPPRGDRPCSMASRDSQGMNASASSVSARKAPMSSRK